MLQSLGSTTTVHFCVKLEKDRGRGESQPPEVVDVMQLPTGSHSHCR